MKITMGYTVVDPACENVAEIPEKTLEYVNEIRSQNLAGKCYLRELTEIDLIRKCVEVLKSCGYACRRTERVVWLKKNDVIFDFGEIDKKDFLSNWDIALLGGWFSDILTNDGEQDWEAICLVTESYQNSEK